LGEAVVGRREGSNDERAFDHRLTATIEAWDSRPSFSAGCGVSVAACAYLF